MGCLLISFLLCGKTYPPDHTLHRPFHFPCLFDYHSGASDPGSDNDGTDYAGSDYAKYVFCGVRAEHQT